MKKYPRAVAAPRVIGIGDLRAAAKKRLPRVVFDYIDGGAGAEVTLRGNLRAFEEAYFRPRHGVVVRQCDLRTRVLGVNLSMPLLLAPVGYSRVLHPGGDVAAAAAAAEAGTAYVLSTLSGHSLEDVRTAANGPVFFQLYLFGGREAAEHSIARARQAGFSALVITIDTAVTGMRERDYRNGLEQLLHGSWWSQLPYLSQLLEHPRWLMRFLLDGGLPKFPNVVAPGRGPLTANDVRTGARLAFAWSDLSWIRALWPGPIAIKGAMGAEDARRAVDEGAAAVIVSNHGGRQLDGVPPSLQALPEIVEAANGRAEVLLDGGIRRGTDVVKALCMGARAVLCGRAYAYGLGAAGRPGVARALEILREDIERTLRLLGCGSVAELDGSYVDFPCAWLRPHDQPGQASPAKLATSQ